MSWLPREFLIFFLHRILLSESGCLMQLKEDQTISQIFQSMQGISTIFLEMCYYISQSSLHSILMSVFFCSQSTCFHIYTKSQSIVAVPGIYNSPKTQESREFLGQVWVQERGRASNWLLHLSWLLLASLRGLDVWWSCQELTWFFLILQNINNIHMYICTSIPFYL